MDHLVDEGDWSLPGPSSWAELLVVKMIVALDVGKYSQITLVKECLNIQVDP